MEPRFSVGKVYKDQKNDLIKYNYVVTLDPDTTNNYLNMSNGNTKATYGSHQKYRDRPERFSAHPQVMARDGLTGCHCWLVEWSTSSDESVYVGVTYNEIDRKSSGTDSQMGNDPNSWVLGRWASPNGGPPILSAWHEGKVWGEPTPPGCSKVAVYLDWSAGQLYFFDMSTWTCLYGFFIKFTKPVYPCFWVGKNGNYVKVSDFY